LTSHVRKKKHGLKEKTHARISRLKNQKKSGSVSRFSLVGGGGEELEQQNSRTSRSKNQNHNDHASRSGKKVHLKKHSGFNRFF
jgi:hypothetical protein